MGVEVKHATLIKTNSPNKLLTPVSKGYSITPIPKLVNSIQYRIFLYSIKNNNRIKGIDDVKLIGDFSDKKSMIYTLFLEAGVFNIDFNELYESYGHDINADKLKHLWLFGRNNIENYIDYISKPGVSIVFYEGKRMVTPLFVTHEKIMRTKNINTVFNIIKNNVEFSSSDTPLYKIIQLGRRHIISTVYYNIFTTPTSDDAYTFIIWDYDYNDQKYVVNGVLNIGVRKSSIIRIDDAIIEIKTGKGKSYELNISDSFPLSNEVLIRTHGKMGIADKIVVLPINKIKMEVRGDKEYYYFNHHSKKVYMSGFEHYNGAKMGNPNIITLSILKGLKFDDMVLSSLSTLYNMNISDVAHNKTQFSISKKTL